MKYIKKFEKYWTEEEIKPTELIKKLTNIFIELGFKVKHRSSEYNIYYFMKNDNVFYMKGGLGSKKLLFNNIGKDSDFLDFLKDYFKNIEGLIIVDYSLQFEIHFENIDKVINQISKKDFKFKQITNKYNL